MEYGQTFDKKLNDKIQLLEKRFTNAIATKATSSKPKKYISLRHDEQSNLRSANKRAR